ncbi:MAG: DUF2156 domain-containing protein [Bacteroidota bacterium]
MPHRLTPPLDRVRRLVLAHGWNATAYQLLNPGLSYWFAPGDRAVVGYVETRRLSGRAMRVVAGEPVCTEDYVAEAAHRFAAAARTQQARVCYFGADERLRTVLAGRPDYSQMTLGAQPVWDPARWDDILASKSSLRAQRNRARNKGVTVRTWPSERAESHPALERLLAEWLASKRMPAMHFLVEPQTLGRLIDRRVFVAERAGSGGDTEPVGYLILSPIPARDGWLVEQIIQGSAAPNGTATLLLDAAMRTAAEAGSPYVTLGLSPLSQRAIETAPGVPHLDNPLWLQGLLGWVRAHGRRFYNFEGLEAFKAKFVPDRWDAITALTQEAAPSLGTLHAIADAFAGPRLPLTLVGGALAQAVSDEARLLRERLGPSSR